MISRCIFGRRDSCCLFQVRCLHLLAYRFFQTKLDKLVSSDQKLDKSVDICYTIFIRCFPKSFRYYSFGIDLGCIIAGLKQCQRRATEISNDRHSNINAYEGPSDFIVADAKFAQCGYRKRI